MGPADDIRLGYERYGRALVRKAERILRSTEAAEDVVHGLFVDLHGRGRARRARDLSYLYRAVTNRCLNVIRDEGRRRDLLASQKEPAFEPRLDRRAIDADLLARLADRLDKKTLDVLVCRYLDEMTQEEIASHLSTSRKTVGKRLDKIRDALDALTRTPAA